MKIKVFLVVLLYVMLLSTLAGQKGNKKIVVSGVVVDAQKNPVSGALIFIDEKNTNKLTNGKRSYKVRVRPDADSIIVVTFNQGVGSAAIGKRSNIDFVLDGSGSRRKIDQDFSRGEEVIDIGYGNVRQKNLSTPVSKIDGEGGKYMTFKDIYDVLKGTPGVVVTGRNIQILGVSSINSGTQPLFVVDGMSVESIDDISPRMVESISVLKGASASIYGSRGANGVILINLIRAPRLK